MATTALLQPDLVADPLERPAKEPVENWFSLTYYWWWLRPLNAYATGWWNIEQITAFHHRMLGIGGYFEEIDISSLNLHPLVTPKRLLDDYKQTLRLYELAEAGHIGLLLNIS